MSEVIKTIGLLLLGIILSLALGVFIINVWITATLGSESFYKNSFEKAGFSIKDFITETVSVQMGETVPAEFTTELGKDIETYMLHVLTYTFGANVNIHFVLDREKYISVLETVIPNDKEIPPEIYDNLFDSMEEQISSATAEVQKNVEQPHQIFALLNTLFWPFVALMIVIVALFFLINWNLRNSFSWLGNFLLWPTLLGLIPLVLIRLFLDISVLLPQTVGDLPADMMLVITTLMQTLLDKLILILSVVAIIGLIVWIIHFFLPKKGGVITTIK